MLLSKEKLDELATIHPDIADYASKNPRLSVDMSDFQVMRNGMTLMEKAMIASLPKVSAEEEFYHEIPMRDGSMSALKIHRPSKGANSGPLVVLCFGGGFIGGSNDQLSRTSRALVKTLGATVVNISYRLAPEHKYPAAQYDARDSMEWIASNATSGLLSADPAKGFIMGGVSAGGALTASLSRILQDEPLAYPLTGQWLSVPSIMDATCIPKGYEEYYISPEQQSDNAFFSRKTREALKAFTEWDSSSPLRYAVNSKTPLSGQPKTYFQVCGMDPLRDDALIYDEMLKLEGVKTKVDIYEGCPHGHFAGFPGLEITDRANIDTVVGVGWLLGKEVAREDARKVLSL